VTHTEVEDNRSFNNTFNGIGLVNATTMRSRATSCRSTGSTASTSAAIRTIRNAVPGTATGNVIRGNEATLNGRSGIFLESTATGNTVTKNRLRNNNTKSLATGADAVDLSTGTGTAGTAKQLDQE